MEGVLNFDSYAREPITESRWSIQRIQNILTNVSFSTLPAQETIHSQFPNKAASSVVKMEPRNK